MTTFLGARACAGGESGVARVLSEEQPERLAAARATRPRNSRRLGCSQAVRGERLGATAGGRSGIEQPTREPVHLKVNRSRARPAEVPPGRIVGLVELNVAAPSVASAQLVVRAA